MRLLAFKGNSLISKLIRWQTRSEYSHIAIELDSGEIIEAWHRGGVQIHSCRGGLLDVHEEGTEIDIYSIDTTLAQETVLTQWLKAQVGDRYDFRSVFRFLSRRPASENNRWFCSELAAKAAENVGLELQRAPAHHLSPRDLAMSPRCEYAGSMKLCPVLLSAEIK
jgi:uncharacterized protein YycO